MRPNSFLNWLRWTAVLPATAITYLAVSVGMLVIGVNFLKGEIIHDPPGTYEVSSHFFWDWFLYPLVSVPRTAVAEAEALIGPTIGRSGYRTMPEFDAAVGAKYQRLVDQGYADTMDLVGRGLVKNDPMVIGSRVDSIARTGMRRWLANVEGIQEGPGRIIQINRRLYNPAGTGAYRIPDVYIPGARSVYDATIAEKTISLPQSIDFRAFSGGGNVTIVRPSTLVTPGAQGSYGLYFP